MTGVVRRWGFLLMWNAIVWRGVAVAAAPPETPPGNPDDETSSAAPAEGSEVSRGECIARHEQAQMARRERRLLDARSGLRLCSRAECPAAIRADCVDWLDQVGRSLPSVVVTARARGLDETDVKVFIDGALAAERLSGAALDLDPGAHKFRFESPRWPALERTILVSEGVKDRAIDVEFAPPPAQGSSPRAPEPTRRALPHHLHRFDYVVGGIALASLVTSTSVFAWALLDLRRLQGCAPFCNPDEKAALHTKLVVTDLALGVTLASLAVLYIHVAWPGETGPASSNVAVSLHVDATAEGARLGLRGTF